ncbi:PhoH family protein [Ignavibacteria bacterium CHB1]|nr:MAG: PhoH family protein [Chlorobiota bacterium]KXK04115.1 MAG: phosphate starvation-inducible protein PhoH-like protein [Chlorobi bacterium OLB4]MBV6397902.1 PhoH-like protein [Ignavibacteria bacterium]MCC6884879.1 PhoH family protein [Ignavibacteriales bacterium]MCE7952578.1 PhoH family protein [Chlorobi bacterium CHB7]MDL1886692.1 PhoH family protein [Ignavibacteria bacterium CHB1]OQY76731.1 MAG: phosphate starvation-inducible protein PhoH [Ignavibacteriales bacterium UTCHB1]RIK47975.1
MSVKELNIKLEGINLLNFAGFNDNNINHIRECFDSTIVLRGENLFVKGDEQEVKTIERIINELVFLYNRQGEISTEDVKLILNLVDTGDDNRVLEKYNVTSGDVKDIILFKKNDFIKPRTRTQLIYHKKSLENDIVFAIGPAGTGKTYLAVAFAVSALKKKQVNKIVLTRPAVEAGENLGFLPGDLSEKVDPYLRPLYDALEDMIPFEKLKTYLERNTIEVVPLAYMRGRTLNNSFVILDEAQNTTTIQMKMFLTRLGANSRAIITGDTTQIDIPKRELSGLVQVQKILDGIDGIEFVFFEKSDVVRHKLVKDIIEAYEKHNTEI